MDFEVEALIGAAWHERSNTRTTYRNGSRPRQLDTRLGTLDLKIPKLRQGSTRVQSFLGRPLDGEWLYLWLDANYLKVRQDGRREIRGLGLGQSKAAIFWIEFPRGLVWRGPKGVKLVISDAHGGLKAAISQVLSATWQRCRVHFLRSLLCHVSKWQQTVVSGAVRQVFVQPDRKTAGEVWRHVADQLRARLPKVAALLDAAEHDVLGYMDYAEAHRTKWHSTNPPERLNKEVKRRNDVIGISPNEDSVRRLVGAVLMEQNDDWQLQHRSLTLETMARVATIEEPAITILTRAKSA